MAKRDDVRRAAAAAAQAAGETLPAARGAAVPAAAKTLRVERKNQAPRLPADLAPLAAPDS